MMSCTRNQKWGAESLRRASSFSIKQRYLQGGRKEGEGWTERKWRSGSSGGQGVFRQSGMDGEEGEAMSRDSSFRRITGKNRGRPFWKRKDRAESFKGCGEGHRVTFIG